MTKANPVDLLDNEVELVGKLLERIESEKEQGKGKLNVLDIGCGTGRLSMYLNEKVGCDVTGIDMLQKKIEKAKTRWCSGSWNVEFEMQSAEKMGFRNNVFDVVVSLKALHEIPDPEGALKESNRVLNARRGRILIIDWVGGTAKTSTHAHAPKYFTPAGLEQMLSESGFVNTRVELNREGELMLAEGRKKSGQKQNKI
nr:ubiquinone/menaquinone biosynthesis methyltransferase [uncultured archaeon GZfos9E5]